MKFQQILRVVAKYATLTAFGILLYMFAAKYAFEERGYFAVGGEGFFLFLPVFYYLAATMIRNIIRDIKDRKKR